jgi:hypothetical protein
MHCAGNRLQGDSAFVDGEQRRSAGIGLAEDESHKSHAYGLAANPRQQLLAAVAVRPA